MSLLIVGAYVVAGYYVTSHTSQNGKGLTTEVAAVIVFLLGAMVMFGYEPLAIGLGVVTAAVLAYKQPLHGFVEKLGANSGHCSPTHRVKFALRSKRGPSSAACMINTFVFDFRQGQDASPQKAPNRMMFTTSILFLDIAKRMY